MRAWRDWKGDLAPLAFSLFGTPSHTIVPPELADEAALLGYLDVSEKELKKIWWYRRRMYRQFEIAKGKGKKRVISAPDDRLKHLQRKTAILLDAIYSVRNPVHGFVVDRSVKTNAQAHLKKRFVLNLDLKEFFPSITENRVSGMLRALGLDNRVSRVVARICCNNGHLPQGSPTSPVLSNMICFSLDKRLLAIAKEARCIYTRYADDITFSSNQPPTSLFDGTIPPAGPFSPAMLAPKLRSAFDENGFTINLDKAHYADRYSRRMVTGLKVNEVINVDRRFVRNLRAALYSVQKLGEKHAHVVFESKYGGGASIADHLQGKITWLRYIKGPSDPVFRSLALRFNALFPGRELKLHPTPSEIRDRAVWVVEQHCAQGTAFFLKDVGLVTAAHCVEGIADIEVYHPSKPANKFKVTLLKSHKHRDLALLKHQIAETEYFELRRSNKTFTVGDELTAVGYPGFGPGDKANVRTGAISALPTKSAVKMIEVTQKLSQGMSGGPLLDGTDGVAGIIHKGGPGEGRDFAVHVTVLNEWLSEVP